jgi:hypothetical protein
MKIVCLNVLGGWQSCIQGTDATFGPVFNSITDLWNWQREVYDTQKEAVNG